MAQHEAEPLTYEQRGATLRGDIPPGYRHDTESVLLGVGKECQKQATVALRDWAPQRGAGLVVSHAARVERESVVALAAPLPLGWAVALCRVVEVVDDRTRFGFAYGTLPQHPESGEELFLIERDENDSVWFRIVAFSRPHDLTARLAGPIARVLQQRATRRYLAAMQHSVEP